MRRRRILALLVVGGCAILATAAYGQDHPAPNGAAPCAASGGEAGGLVYGDTWVITFGCAPRGWVEDTGLANQLGVTAVFHPRRWDERKLSPAILLSYVESEGGKRTVASEMAVDAKNTLQDNSTTKISSGNDLVGPGGARSPSRIFVNNQGWSRVIYRGGGGVIFLSTLRCWKARDCAKFEAAFEAFTASLGYHGNVRIERK